MRDVPYDASVDLWAVGVVTYELLHGYTPFRFDLLVLLLPWSSHRNMKTTMVVVVVEEVVVVLEYAMMVVVVFWSTMMLVMPTSCQLR